MELTFVKGALPFADPASAGLDAIVVPVSLDPHRLTKSSVEMVRHWGQELEEALGNTTTPEPCQAIAAPAGAIRCEAMVIVSVPKEVFDRCPPPYPIMGQEPTTLMGSMAPSDEELEWAYRRSQKLEESYFNALMALGTLRDLHGSRKVVGMPLFPEVATAEGHATDLECLLRACVRYAGTHGSVVQGLGAIGELRVYCPQAAWAHAVECGRRRCVAFMDGPLEWDSVGDARLWHHLMVHFNNARYDAMGPLDVLVECQREAIRLTGAPIDGAASRGFVLEEDGANRVFVTSGALASLGFPVLVSNMVRMGMNAHGPDKARFIIRTELWRGEGHVGYKLMLPHDMVPLLEGLRGPLGSYTMRESVELDRRGKVRLVTHRLRGAYFVVRYSLRVQGREEERYDFDFRGAASLCEGLSCSPRDLVGTLRRYCEKNGARALVAMVAPCVLSKGWGDAG